MKESCFEYRHILWEKTYLTFTFTCIICRPFGNPEDAYYLRHVCETTKSFSKLLYHNYTGNNQKSSKTSKAHLKDEAMFSDDTKKEWTKVTEFLVKVFIVSDREITLKKSYE